MNPAPHLRTLTLDWWLLLILGSVLVLFLTWDRSAARADRLVYDVLLQTFQPAPDPRVFLVEIDDRSLREIGPWPWPRDVQADLVRSLTRLRPRAIAYDVLLLDTTTAQADAALSQAMRAAPPLYLPLLVGSPGGLDGSSRSSPPLAPFRQAADGLGHVNLVPDGDGVHRRIRLVEEDGRRRWPHLMVQLCRASDALVDRSVDAKPRLIPFTGPAGTFPSVAASAILRGEVPEEIVRGRLVVVGATAEGLGDRYPVALGRNGGIMSGMEIQANILNGLLSNRMIRDASLPVRVGFGVAPLWLFLFALKRLEPRTVTWHLVPFFLLPLLLSALALHGLKLWMSPVPAVAALLLVYPLWGWRRLAAVSRYMLDQLETLRAEPDAIVQPSDVGTRDPVARQIQLLGDAVARLRSLRRFVSESLYQIPDAIFVLDPDGRILIANAAAERLYDSPGAGEIENAQQLLERLAPPTSQAASAWPPAPEGARLPLWSVDRRHFDIQMAPRQDRDGARPGWIMRIRDDTEIWLARERREDMLRFLSHDMRAPQASILALLATADPDEISSELSQHISDQAHRTLGLAENFVQLARAETLTIRMELHDLAESLIEAVDTVWPQAQIHRIRIETEGEQDEWLIRGDRGLLTRALINLLDNAIKYSPEGSLIHCRLFSRLVERQRMIACSVADSGVGIAPSQLPALFERFRRLDPHGGSRDSGLGLGLALVQTVASRHGGKITCTSKPGEGSIFTLWLPAAPEHQLAEDGPEGISSSGSKDSRSPGMDDREMA